MAEDDLSKSLGTPGPKEPPSSGMSSVARILLTGAFSLGCGFLAVFLIQRAGGHQAQAPVHGAGTKSTARPGGLEGDRAAPSASRSEFHQEKEIGPLRSKLSDLAQKMGRLQEQLDAIAKSPASPNLTTLRIKVAELTRTMSAVAALPAEVDLLDSQLDNLSRGVETIRAEIESLPKPVEGSRSSG